MYKRADSLTVVMSQYVIVIDGNGYVITKKLSIVSFDDRHVHNETFFTSHNSHNH